MTWFALLLALGLVAVHLFVGQLQFLDRIPRSRWLSFAGGAAVAYIFVHVLPDLAEAQQTVEETRFLGLDRLERHVYLVALVGLALFYGLERAIRSASEDREPEQQDEGANPGIFWLHVASFALYSALIGYLLLHRLQDDPLALLLFFVAMALHFLTSDFGLHKDYRAAYEHTARWLLALGVLAGWALGALTTIHEGAVALLFAFLAGGVVLNVLKEELPEERRSRFWPFALGVVGYAALLLAV